MTTAVQDIDLCVIGGGISGLALAAFASKHLSVCVLEKNSTVGGILQSTTLGSAVFDEAANGWLDSEPSVADLIDLIGCTSDITPANTDRATRFLFHHKTLHPLSPKLLMQASPLLSWLQKLRALRELVWSPTPINEPSMAEFMRRRFGEGVIDNFLAPMCAGIYADAPENISLRAAFPNLWNMATQGSILRQLFSRLRDKTRKHPHLTSLKMGTHQLCQNITTHLRQCGHSVLTDTPATHITYDNGWIIQTPNGNFRARSLALTCPAPAQTHLLDTVHPSIAMELSRIQYSPVAVVLQTFAKDDFTNPPSGFGALLSRSEQQSGLLGILFSSHLYPHRCPSDTIMTRSILGGSIAPEIVSTSDEHLQSLALQGHREAFDCPNLSPTNVRTIRWHRAIPRYSIGHWALQERIRTFHNTNPLIRLSGNHLFGVAVKDCIRIGYEHAQHFIHTVPPKS